MESIATQWPLLAGFMTLYGGSLIIIRSLYERERADLKADLREAREIARAQLAVVDKLSDRLDAVLVRFEREERRG